MKKIVAVVLAAVMMIGMTTTVFATNSVHLTPTTEVPQVVISEATAKGVPTTYHVLAAGEVTPPPGFVQGQDNRVELAIPGVVAGGSYLVIHKRSDNGIYELLTPTEVADGGLVVHMNNCSPVWVFAAPAAAPAAPAQTVNAGEQEALARLAAENQEQVYIQSLYAAAAAGDQNALQQLAARGLLASAPVAAKGAVSPKTADSAALPIVLAVIMAGAGVGIVFVNRKRSF